ncbi:MAG: G8 domain-containing protein, partial [Candidatus Rokuibacteriota bacterium]
MKTTIKTLTVATILAIVSGATGAVWARDLTIEKCPKKLGEQEDLQQATLDVADDLIVQGVCRVLPGTTVEWGNVTITSGGVLQFSDASNLPIKFTAKSITIESGGTLIAGAAARAFGTNGAKLTLTFTGTPPATCQMLDSHTDWCGKGILVKAGATLNLYGAKGVAESGVSWTHLSVPAGPTVQGAKVQSGGASTLQLAKDVSQGAGAWKKDDWIAVATTSFSPFDTEFVQLAADATRDATTGGSQVTLAQPLKHYHFGGKDPGPPSADNYNGSRSGVDYNYGVDERAEVGLITRSIKLTATVDSANLHWGGEIKILKDFAQVVVQGVEIEKFGKNHLGAYPIHLHRLGPVAAGTLTINANSVHHSYNKCVTIHSTQNVTIENMVCARIIGHIFYQEYG